MKQLTRRHFMRTMGLGTVVMTLHPFPKIYSPGNDLDRFGGLKTISFNANGYFRLEKGNRWWLVTPDGNAFLSWGLNHTDMIYLQQDYNKDFWMEKFGAKAIDDPAFQKGFIEKVFNDLEYFGMNTLGCHGRKENLGNITTPYLQGLFFAPTAYWSLRGAQGYPDVWSIEFSHRCDTISESICLPKQNDPFLIGYTFTNVPILTDLDAEQHGMVPWGAPQKQRPTWPRALRNRDGNTPGKMKYVEKMKQRYPALENFNQRYKTEFATWDELLLAVDWSPNEKVPEIDDAEDNHDFMLDIYEKYYQVTCQAIRGKDPNHLLFGDPLNANTGTTDDIVNLVARHTDLISFQYYGPYDEQDQILDHWYKLSGKPLFNTDSNFTAVSDNMPNPVGWICKDQKTRAAYFLDYATRAFCRPFFVGWNWCGWVDGWESWRTVQQHNGLQDPFGNYHHPLPKVMARFGSRLYEYALGRREPVLVNG